MSAEITKIFPVPVQRDLKVADFFLHGKPHVSVTFMERAAHEIDDARQQPGYPQDRLQQDEQAYLEFLCKVLDDETFHVASITSLDRDHLKELCINKIRELMFHDLKLALHLGKRTNRHFPGSVSMRDVLVAALNAEDAVPAQMDEQQHTRLRRFCLRTVAAFMEQDKALAFNVAERAHKIFPESVGLTRALGNLYFDFERYANAIPHLRTALEANPDNFRTARRLHKSYLETGKDKHAAMLIHRYKYNYPENPHILLMRGYHLLYRDRPEGALECADRAYTQYDQFPPAVLLKALAHARMGHEVEARYWFEANEAAGQQKPAAPGAAPTQNAFVDDWLRIEAAPA
jgi:tetratricopeptide (TPR) repeat protein